MLAILIDVAVPASLFVLLLVAGTEIRTTDLRTTLRQPQPLLLGTLGQLVLLPLTGMLIVHAAAPSPSLASSFLLLAMSPGGGISNYYCYLGRLNVFLSAAITFVGTLISLLTIPFFLWAIPTLEGEANTFAAVPVGRIVMQLIILMVLPMMIGVAVKQRLPLVVKAYGTQLRGVSNLAIAVILVLVVWSARSSILAHYDKILLIAMLFLLAALMIGWLLGRGLSPDTQSVLIIESGTRNVAVALLLGSSLLTTEGIKILAGFLAAYFILEVVFMLLFARIQALRSGQPET
jgi:BASS family bile acid:Na+ symporter